MCPVLAWLFVTLVSRSCQSCRWMDLLGWWATDEADSCLGRKRFRGFWEISLWFQIPSGIDVGESGSVCQPCDGLATCPGCTPPPSHLVFYCHQPFTRLCFFQSRFTHRLERCSLDLSDVTHVCVSAACLSKLRTCPHGASEWQHCQAASHTSRPCLSWARWDM